MLIAGNWKMNTTHSEAVALAADVVRGAVRAKETGVKVAVCPPLINIGAVIGETRGTNVLVGAQNMHQEKSGAYTGEVSGVMIRVAGCSLVILGHSERRQYFGEDDVLVNRKCAAAAEAGLVPIVCVGETIDQRNAGQESEVVGRQIAGAFEGIKPSRDWHPVVAYEPVWAIGTGLTATPEQAQAMHRFIRDELSQLWGEDVAARTKILYGGSMKPSNAEELLGQPDINGGLIGGASLNAVDFTSIIEAGVRSET